MDAFQQLSQQTNRILETGIVVAIDKVGKTFDKFSPIGSCKIRLTGEQTTRIEDIRYFTPLLPPNLVILPSEGEEVYVIFSVTNRREIGYYFTRRATIEGFYEYGDPFKNAKTVEAQYGGPKPRIERRNNLNVTNQTIKDYRSGDVSLNGNPGNGILFSYSETGKPIIDIYNSTDAKRIQNIYPVVNNSARIVLADDVNLDNRFSVSKNISRDSNINSSVTFIISDKTRIWNPNGNELTSAILGAQQEEWLKNVIDLLVDVIDKLIIEITELSNHTHPTGTGPSGPALTKVNIEKVKSEIEELKTKIKSEKDTIKNHHSINLLIN